MNLCLFDAQPEATKLWQELASLHGLQLNIFPSWNGIEAIPDETTLLIVDQSAVSSAYSYGAELLQACGELPHVIVVATGHRLNVQAVVDLMKGGVSSLIEKPYSQDVVSKMLGEMVEAARVLRASKEEFEKLSQLFASLTSREKNVLDCVLEGVSNKDTAVQLNVSVRTVESRRAKVYRKLELKHVAELVRKMDRLEQLHMLFSPSREYFERNERVGLRQPQRVQSRLPQVQGLNATA